MNHPDGDDPFPWQITWEIFMDAPIYDCDESLNPVTMKDSILCIVLMIHVEAFSVI